MGVAIERQDLLSQVVFNESQRPGERERAALVGGARGVAYFPEAV